MSGLAAVIGTDRENALETMLDKLKHRGPEDKLIYDNDQFRLGELNMTDGQERETGDDAYGIIFDGRPIYNGKAVNRAEILDLFKTQGPAFIKKTTGNFAIIISSKRDFFIARDLYGTKPLYFSMTDNNIFLASEIKSLRALTDSIETFPPGHYCTEIKEFKPYREVPAAKVTRDISALEAAITLHRLLTSAVDNAMQENNEAGSFLSGGLDSSVIVAAACKLSGKKLPTFAVGLESSGDVLNARKVAKHLGTDHYEYLYTPEELLNILPEVIYYLESFDVELVNSSMANYLAARLAHEKGIKITLSGEGADELLGGYHYLKKCASEQDLNKETTALLKGLHNGGLQRVDRMTQAHSVECIMPFMDSQVVEFALGLPCHYKISSSGIEKWILRKAFSSELPDEVVWRTKAQFGIGTGNEDIMKELVAQKVSWSEYEKAIEKHSFQFKNKEEYYYYKIFKEFYPSDAAEKTVNRWLV